MKKKPSVSDKRVSPFRTICEVHREINDILTEDKTLDSKKYKKIISLLDEAYNMGKRMNKKLREYKKNYDDGWWEKSRKEIVKEKSERRK